jgi:hypothetical protein
MGARNSVSAEKRIAPPGTGRLPCTRNCGARHRVRPRGRHSMPLKNKQISCHSVCNVGIVVSKIDY